MIPSDLYSYCRVLWWDVANTINVADALGRGRCGAGLGWVTIINTRYSLATQGNPQITQIKVERNNIKYVNEF